MANPCLSHAVWSSGISKYTWNAKLFAIGLHVQKLYVHARACKDAPGRQCQPWSVAAWCRDIRSKVHGSRCLIPAHSLKYWICSLSLHCIAGFNTFKLPNKSEKGGVACGT